MSHTPIPTTTDVPNTRASKIELSSAAKKSAALLSQQLFGALIETDRLKWQIAAHSLIAIKLDPRGVRSSAQRLAGEAVAKSTRKYGVEASYLTGHYLLKAGEDGHNRDTINEASRAVSYIAELIAAIERGVGKHNDANPNERIDYAREDAFVGVSKLVNDLTVTAMLKDYRKSLKPTDADPGNTGTTDDQMVASIARAFQTAGRSVASFSSDEALVADGRVGVACVTTNDDGGFDIHEVMALDNESTFELIQQSRELPTSDVDDAVNYVANILLAGSEVLPDQISDVTKPGKTGKATDDYRQVFFDPGTGAISVGSGRKPGEPSMVVNSADLWPGLPNRQGLIYTPHRLKIDPLVNRFDRRRFTITTAPREQGDTWLAKLLYAPIAGGGGLPLQINAFEHHALDFWRPEAADCNWQGEFVLTRAELKSLERAHLAPALTALGDKAPDDIAEVSLAETSVSLHRDDQEPVVIADQATSKSTNGLRVRLFTQDLRQVLRGIIALETNGDIEVSIDPEGLIRFQVETKQAWFDFFVALILPRKSERSDRFYRSMRALNEQDAEQEEQSDAA